MTNDAKEGSEWAPVSKSEKDEIHAQLERILADPLFQNSRRYPGFLRHVVNQTLEGHGDQLKERTLGVEVFGRKPDYDTGLDNVVRSTAGEIRRRLAQYYQDPSHKAEIRIDLPAGSYVPRFAPVLPEAVVEAAIPAKKQRHWLLYAAVSLAICIAAVYFWRNGRIDQDEADRFWRPVLSHPGSVLICIGTSSGTVEAAVPQATKAPSRDVPVSSATALSKFVGYLQVKKKPFHIRQDSEAAFADFRDGPAILIGAFINQWTGKLTGQLRFNFRKDPDRQLRLIVDSRSQPPREWAASDDVTKLSEDYALVSRFLDQSTGNIILAAGGLHRYGTVAAGEFLTDPASFKELASLAPAAVDRQNVQIVLATKVIGNNSGKPRIVATYFW